MAVSNTPYGPSWNGVTTKAPSLNAAYDKIAALEAIIAGLSAGAVSYRVFDVATTYAGDIQAAVDACDAAGGGTVYMAPGQYPISTTLTVSGGTTQNKVNLIGDGPNVCEIHWTGATNQVAVKLSNEKYVKVGGFRIQNDVAAGTTIGLQLTGTESSGTQTTGSVIEQIIIDGFDIQIDTGGSDNTSSEIQWRAITVQSGRVGIWFHDGNAISHNFCGLNMSSLTSAILATSLNFHIYGGSSSACGDWDCSGGGTVTVSGYYTEDYTDAMYFTSGSSVQTINILNCVFKRVTPGDPVISASGVSQVNITGGSFNGEIESGGSSCGFVVMGVGVWGADGAATIVTPVSGTPLIFSRNNSRRNSSNVITGVYAPVG